MTNAQLTAAAIVCLIVGVVVGSAAAIAYEREQHSFMFII